jgi:hypothetical protein
MILNFYLPDEIITETFGPVIETADERENIENVYYIMFLDKYITAYPPGAKMREFLSSEEMLAKIEKARKHALEIVHLNYKRRPGGNDEKG